MLDDLKMIHTRDSEDALGVVEKQSSQLEFSFNTHVEELENIKNIVVAGMGGSAIPAVYVKTWPGTSVPLEIVRDYDIPSFIDDSTLFIASSYSGNTEETLSALAQAESKKAKIVIVCAGGKLEQIATDKKYPLFKIPSGIQPRMSVFYFLVAFVDLLENQKLVKQGSTVELKQAGQWLSGQIKELLPTVPTANNLAKQIALDLIGKSVVVYSGPKLFPAANKFKICLNENAKNIAWVNQYSEFNHNEFVGWTAQPVDKPYAVVEIRSNLEHERIQKRFKLSEQLLSGRRPAPIVINPKGDTLLKQLLWTSNFCDFVSVYTALLNGVNPTPVELVEKLKTMLNK
ncbi:MAG TPA: bifunctional phosphoglucose/phosphomannose isomerase [Patescibacteria group bacterium]|nr:bifunctional phosphoglucose/phosphomannose isomerase [Patescibacteria group bacterium]